MQNQTLQKIPPDLSEYDLDKDFPFLFINHTVESSEIKKLHIHNVLEIGICLSGVGTFIVEDKVFSYEAGDLFFINENEMHRASVPEGKTSDWIFLLVNTSLLLGNSSIPPEIMQIEGCCGSNFINRFPIGKYPKLNIVFYEIISEWKNKSFYYHDKIKSLFTSFLIEFRRIMQDFKTESKGARVTGKMLFLLPALEHIYHNYSLEINMSALAKLCGIKTRHFQRRFVEAFGKGPKEYLNDYRISMAANLLKNTDKKVLEISLICGFQTLSCFNRQFSKKMLYSPRKWRNRVA